MKEMQENEKTKVMQEVDTTDKSEERSRKDKIVAFLKRNKLQCGVVAGMLIVVIAGGTFAIASSNLAPGFTDGANASSHSQSGTNNSSSDAVSDNNASQGDNANAENNGEGEAIVNEDGSVTYVNNDNASNNAGGNASNGNSGSNNGTSQGHTHSWTPVYRTVHHDAVTEDQPIYKPVTATICNVCGADITGNASSHGYQHAIKGEGSGHHEAVVGSCVSGYKTVTTKAAYDEQVLDHCTCSCGATS